MDGREVGDEVSFCFPSVEIVSVTGLLYWCTIFSIFYSFSAFASDVHASDMGLTWDVCIHGLGGGKGCC